MSSIRLGSSLTIESSRFAQDPPRIEAGASTTLAVLVAHAAGPTSIEPPESIVVMSPPSMVTRTTDAGDRLTAPDEAQLALARQELGLTADAPVPLALKLEAGGFEAVTTIWLGATGTNPALDGVEIDGRSPDAMLEIQAGVDVSLRVDADDERSSVTWLSSCGTLHDFDLSHAVLNVEPEDSHDGELVLVVRDFRGGTSWRVWPIDAE